MRVLFIPELRDYFRELAQILYEKDYFGFEESAIHYAESLFNDIEKNLPTKQKILAPPYFERYGKRMYYVYKE